MSAEDKQATCQNTATQMEGIPLFIKQRHVRACHNADPEYGRMLSEALGFDLPEQRPAQTSWDKRNKVK